MGGFKHLPANCLPSADLALFRTAYEPGDFFEETAGLGAHLMPGTRKMIATAYRRWLGYLLTYHPDELSSLPAERIRREFVIEFVELLLREVKPVSAAICIEGLHYVARFGAPSQDWRWLQSFALRLRARSRPEDRFARLIPGWITLDHGLLMMDDAMTSRAEAFLEQEILYRDGLIMALLSCWPLRRRSITSLTVSRHIEVQRHHVYVHLYAEDMKSKRAEIYPLHERLVPYLQAYLAHVRPRLLGQCRHDGLWVSRRGQPLSPGRLYDAMRLRTRIAFKKPLGLHDFRRSAGTFLATEAPEMVGCIPGILQHTHAEVSENHYNLARSVSASRRFAKTVTEARRELRLLLGSNQAAREP